MADWLAFQLAAFSIGLGMSVAFLLAPRVRRYWRRYRYRRAVALEAARTDPVRLAQIEQQQAHELAKAESERAATFCERYCQDLIAQGIPAKEAYQEALAIYQNEVA